MARLLLQVLCAVVLLVAAGPGARADTGMLSWTDSEIVQALDAFVPRLMGENGVPGAQVALVRGGRLVYERGFGVANVIGRTPVTPDTMFEAASLSKPVTAHVAMQLVAAGKLRLDKDVGLGLEPAWLEIGEDGRVPPITLEQILTHRSGLTNDIRRATHEVVSPPGGPFAYAGEGFGYLGYVIRAHEQLPFEDVMQRRLFGPLGMTSSGFAVTDEGMGRMATGHVPLWVPLALVFGPFLVVFVVSSIVAFFVVRLVLQQPHMEASALVFPAILGGIAAFVAVLELVGLGLLTAVLLIALIFLLLVAFVSILWRLVFHLLGFTRERPGMVVRREDGAGGRWTRAAAVLAVLSLTPFLFSSVPVPLRAATDVHPAASLRSTARDIALFAQELMRPELLSASDMRQMARPQVKVGHGAPDGLAWGLGIGVRDRRLADGDVQRTLWQWGSNPGYASILVIEPDAGAALVVLTNAQTGGDMAQELAAHVFGGLEEYRRGEMWTVPFDAVAPMY